MILPVVKNKKIDFISLLHKILLFMLTRFCLYAQIFFHSQVLSVHLYETVLIFK